MYVVRLMYGIHMRHCQIANKRGRYLLWHVPLRSWIHFMVHADIVGMKIVCTRRHLLGQHDLDGASILVCTCTQQVPTALTTCTASRWWM